MGAYFASVLSAAKAEGRIGRVAADPLLPLRAFFDLGGSGASADAMAIWIVQWVGQEIRVRPDATLEELRTLLTDKCQATVSLSPIFRSLQGLTLPRKKKSHRQ